MNYVMLSIAGGIIGCLAVEDPETLVSISDAARDAGITLRKATQKEFEEFDETACLPLEDLLPLEDMGKVGDSDFFDPTLCN